MSDDQYIKTLDENIKAVRENIKAVRENTKALQSILNEMRAARTNLEYRSAVVQAYLDHKKNKEKESE